MVEQAPPPKDPEMALSTKSPPALRPDLDPPGADRPGLSPDEIEQFRTNVVDEPAWWEKYHLPLPPTGGMPRGTGGTRAVPLSGIAEYGGDGTWRVRSRANDWMRS